MTEVLDTVGISKYNTVQNRRIHMTEIFIALNINVSNTYQKCINHLIKMLSVYLS